MRIDMVAISGIPICAIAVLLAFICANAIWRYVDARHLRIKLKNQAIFSVPETGEKVTAEKAVESKSISLMIKTTRALSLKRNIFVASSGFMRIFLQSRWFEKNINYTGLKEVISLPAFINVRMKYAFAFAAIGALIGTVFSIELALLMGAVGFTLGWRSPKQALVQRIEWRTRQMEHHLPEMLDVVALGMRSGLSFDASIALYSSYFDIPFASEISNSYSKWASGLETREEALRGLSQTYRSSIFGRVVETVVRSIRFGSSMAEGLEAESAEARAVYKAQREEEVAKAPVKMMIPTGVLILPAMLILVLGPVLLELMEGGF